MTSLLTAHIRNPGTAHCVWNTNKVTCFTVTTATMCSSICVWSLGSILYHGTRHQSNCVRVTSVIILSSLMYRLSIFDPLCLVLYEILKNKIVEVYFPIGYRGHWLSGYQVEEMFCMCKLFT